MPSIQDIAGFVASLVLAAAAIGTLNIFERGVVDLQKVALRESKKPWGCPSLFNKRACASYDPARYKDSGIRR